MNDKHLSSQFDSDLNQVCSRVLEMGGLVESQIVTAMQALNTFDRALVDEVIATEQRLNTMEVEIDEEREVEHDRQSPLPFLRSTRLTGADDDDSFGHFSIGCNCGVAVSRAQIFVIREYLLLEQGGWRRIKRHSGAALPCPTWRRRMRWARL